MTNATHEEDDMKVLTENIWKRNQSWYITRVVLVKGHRLQLSVRRNAYDNQSHARISRWNGEEWKLVGTVPIEDTAAHDVSYVHDRSDVLEARLITACGELLDEARAILGL